MRGLIKASFPSVCGFCVSQQQQQQPAASGGPIWGKGRDDWRAAGRGTSVSHGRHPSVSMHGAAVHPHTIQRCSS